MSTHATNGAADSEKKPAAARAASKSAQGAPDIPNRVDALPQRKPGPIVAAIIVAIFAAQFIHMLVTNENLEWGVVWTYLFNEHVLSGVGWTLILTVASMLIAIVLAILLAVMRKSSNVVLRGVSWFYIWFFRGTPVYTQLVFWGLISVLIPKLSIGIPFGPEFWTWDTADVFTAGRAAVIGLALNEAAYLAEIVRAGLEAVDPGQREAAQALGMGPGLIMRRIILPQAMRIIIPPTGNEVIGMLKTTSLVLAVPFTLELQYVTNSLANRVYKPIPLLIVAALWYLVITSILMFLQSKLEKHFGKGFDIRGEVEQIGPSDSTEAKRSEASAEDRNDVLMTGLNA